MDGNPVPGTSQIVSKDRQKLMFYLNIHQNIINLLKDGMYILAEIYDNP